MIVLDTSFIVSYWVETDSNHERAKKLYNEKIKNGNFGEAMITDYIFDETVTTVLYRTKSLEKAIAAGNNLTQSTHLIKVDDFIYDDSWKAFKSQKDTEMSFTDCTIVSAMKLHSIVNVATFDRDFKEVGGIKVIDS